MKKENFKNRKKERIVILIEECPNKKGLVFIMHGLGGSKEQPHIMTIARSFYDNGYTTVRFDATNSVGESDGKLEFATATNYYEDLEDVIQWAKTEKWYQEPFCLAGHSLGGFCISFYTENHLEKVKALAPISTFISGELFVKAFKEKEGNESLEEWERRGYREWESSSAPGLIKRLNWPFVPDSLRYNLLTKAQKIKVPVILIVGENDTDVPAEHQKILYDALDTKKEFHIIRGAKHIFMEDVHLAELKTILDNWLKNINSF